MEGEGAMGEEEKEKINGSGMEIKEGMTVYGLMVSAGGYFSAEGIVVRTDQEGFCVNYKMLADVRYKYSDIGRNIYLDKEIAESEAETAQYEAEKAEKEDFEEQNKKPFGKF